MKKLTDLNNLESVVEIEYSMVGDIQTAENVEQFEWHDINFSELVVLYETVTEGRIYVQLATTDRNYGVDLNYWTTLSDKPDVNIFEYFTDDYVELIFETIEEAQSFINSNWTISKSIFTPTPLDVDINLALNGE